MNESFSTPILFLWGDVTSLTQLFGVVPNSRVFALQIGMTTNLGTNEFSRQNQSFLLPFVVKICKGQNHLK